MPEAGKLHTAVDRHSLGEPCRAADDDLLGPRGPRLEDAAPAVHADVRRDGPRFAEFGDGNGARPPREGPAPSRIPRHRGVGGTRGRRRRREGDLLPRLRLEPCPPASDGHRPRDPAAVRADRPVSGSDGLEPRRRIELRGFHPPVLRGCIPWQRDPLHRGPERRSPEPPRGIPVRLRRPRGTHADAEDVHPRPPRGDDAGPRGRPAVPRLIPDPLPPAPPRPDRHYRLPHRRTACLRTGPHVRPDGGVPPRPGERVQHRLRDRRGPEGERNRRADGHRVQRERPRFHGHGRIRGRLGPLRGQRRARIKLIKDVRVLRRYHSVGGESMGAYLRTFALFVLLTGIFDVFGYLIGSVWLGNAIGGIVTFLLLAGAMNAIAYFASDRIVLWSYR